MGIEIFIYSKTNNDTLIISCFHEKTAALSTIGPRSKPLEPIKLDLPDEKENAFAVLRETVIHAIQQKILPIANSVKQVIYAGDINLGYKGKKEYPPFLFGKDIDKLFSEQMVVKILVSSSQDVVEEAKKTLLIENNVVICIKTKAAAKIKSYLASAENKKSSVSAEVGAENSMNLASSLSEDRFFDIAKPKEKKSKIELADQSAEVSSKSPGS
ncbi:Uncharacterised protein [Legionella lansingensis]|uniref:Uncharacterized protein n=1 Tax=Legionella lansingensis TaxID=45067 RepID=A0A0W0VFF4_9GAMM|nr:hypothetical protein [Legionella lansingensis]KTD18795.1 hypothetical protein Llan_2398 [Legionella lansingensis]SNV43159.1 Uncharacterised protein [Legionella lansingensis]